MAISFEQVEVLANKFGLEVRQRHDDPGMWYFFNNARCVYYWPDSNRVQLAKECLRWERYCGGGAREGDFAVAMVIALTGINPVEANELRLCETIRSHLVIA